MYMYHEFFFENFRAAYMFSCRFRDCFFLPGSSLKSMDIFRNFMNREPSYEAYYSRIRSQPVQKVVLANRKEVDAHSLEGEKQQTAAWQNEKFVLL